MDESTKNSPCKECDGDEGLQLHAEVEHLRQHLAERDSHIVALEGEFIKSTARANELEEQVGTWREKYERLYDSHKRVQKLNQVLEDKLLQMVDKMKGEKSQLTKDIATLSVRLAESKHNYSMLQKENERYKNDMNLAIQLLQCKPDNFVSQKLDNLPVDTQARVSQYVMSKTSKPSSSTQSKNGNDIDTFDASEYEFNISASLMSKILEDSIQDTVTKHCDTCTCNKSQNKPFCYNESYYSVATQTLSSGEMKNSLCLNCNSDVKSVHSNLSIRSMSPHPVKLINDKVVNLGMITPLYILPQNTEPHKEIAPPVPPVPEKPKNNGIVNDKIKMNDKNVLEQIAQKDTVPKQQAEDLKQYRKTSSVNMEPAVHHKLCDRTKSSISSKKSSIQSAANEEPLLPKDVNKDMLNNKEVKPIIEKVEDNISVRKNSHSSMGAVSRTSSIAKSTVSTHKSNTAVGPGPRFCHLRMQAGSKNILLDNAEPDVPPVLYRRQSKCNENSIFKDLTDEVDNFIDLEKTDEDIIIQEDIKNDNIVVESTLIDVHVDNSNKDVNVADKNTAINPVLLNVSSSPLQPLKTHTFSNSSENNNNKSQSIASQQNTTEIDNLLNDFNADINNTQNNNVQSNEDSKKLEVFTPTDENDVKIFNFDRYEQKKLTNQFNKPLRKIDMSQLHSLENTRISKDLPPQGDEPKPEKKPEIAKAPLPSIVNVYPNLTQTHLKVNDNKVFTNEQSTSSLSSDDSAAVLQKQQLLRVAEWVEKNLEQQNNFNDPLEEDVNFTNRTRRDSKLSRLTETLNELALNMPHPVSKYSKSYARDGHNAWVHNNIPGLNQEKAAKLSLPLSKLSGHVAKETIFPVECGDATVTEISNTTKNRETVADLVAEGLRAKGNKEITPEDLARMEYNVKKFLLSGPHWVNPGSVGRSRRTSSKTETDV
ncbi:bromodomain-containing protein DDB_G0270170-like isoform X1 [Trichoplusia ni]|uniref:Bromodomain-containing protein DDB_G0270170-like isoform X1 n=2 Tax=Trichoplusia ni TaxID=7111 RepID=A0A7E5VPM1_TRINI|nr:bromodomain-containing protein DDB_G0270170-like isoform X1 [Trichoplusia ni]